MSGDRDSLPTKRWNRKEWQGNPSQIEILFSEMYVSIVDESILPRKNLKNKIAASWFCLGLLFKDVFCCFVSFFLIRILLASPRTMHVYLFLLRIVLSEKTIALGFRIKISRGLFFWWSTWLIGKAMVDKVVDWIQTKTPNGIHVITVYMWSVYFYHYVSTFGDNWNSALLCDSTPSKGFA